MRLTREAIQKLGWAWDTPYHVMTSDGPTDLRIVDAKEWGHRVRDALRRQQ